MGMNWEKAAAKDKTRRFPKPRESKPMTDSQRKLLTSLLGGEPPDYNRSEASDTIGQLLAKDKRG